MSINFFDEGDLVRYNHDDYGEGSGVVAGKDVDKNEVFVYPKYKIQGKEFLILHPDRLILTPF